MPSSNIIMPSETVLGIVDDVSIEFNDATITLDFTVNVNSFDILLDNIEKHHTYRKVVFNAPYTGDVPKMIFKYPDDVSGFNVRRIITEIIGDHQGIAVDFTFNHSCIHDECDIEWDISNDTIVIENSIVNIKSNVTIKDSSIVLVHNENKEKNKIIVDGSVLNVENTTITYKIESKEAMDKIKDGDKVVIIEVVNGGEIKGEIENVEIEMEEEEECKEIKAIVIREV